MKKELKDFELNDVVGGTVVISKDYMVVGFTSLSKMFHLKDCTYKQARDFAEDLHEANRTMSNKEFDTFCLAQMDANGWIADPYW